MTDRVVEQLLQLLVGVVDAELLEAVELEDLKASNVEDADEAGALPLGPVQRAVDPCYDPFEQSLVRGFADRFNGELNLLLALSLGDVVPPNLDARFEKSFGQVGDLDAQQVGHFLCHGVVGKGGLVGGALLLELHVAEHEGGGDDSPDAAHVLIRNPHHLHRVLGGGKLLDIVDARNLDTAVGHECVVLRILEDHLS